MTKQTIDPQQVRYVTVHTAKADAHHFLLGASIVKYRDMWVCAYGQSMELENDSRTRFACKYSFDNCATWSNEVEIAGVDGNRSHSHGILFKYFESRKNMMIALGECGKEYAFPNVHPIRRGYRVPPAFLNSPQWAYPYAVEEDGKLYVVYSENKENCELAIIPLLPSNKNV